MSDWLGWLASEHWRHLIIALLHTLWTGSVLAIALFAILRRNQDPFIRYRWSTAALGAVLASGLIAWSILETRPPGAAPSSPVSSVPASTASLADPLLAPGSPSLERFPPPLQNMSLDGPARFGDGPAIGQTRFSQVLPWLGFLWLCGAALMLLRAAGLVWKAEQLRRQATPLQDDRIRALIEAARRQLGVARSIQAVVTNRLTSPAVMGVMVPVLILPLSFVTTLSLEQLRLIVLHELAHVRRGDYLVNLFQLLAESLLFFNPAVWFISSHIRQEREACCDALACAAAGSKLEFARVLAQAAEGVGAPLPETVLAFGRRRGGSLKDRIQRLLIPGYSPGSAMSWRAMLGAILAGGMLLVLSAIGTQWTVQAAAKLLTPQQRVDRIEAAMKTIGQEPEPDTERRPDVTVKVKVVSTAGEPLPGIHGQFMVYYKGGTSYIAARTDKEGIAKAKVNAGDLYFAAWTKDRGPAFLGPINTRETNQLNNLETVLETSREVAIQVVDAQTDVPIPGARLQTLWSIPDRTSGKFNTMTNMADAAGVARLRHSGSIGLAVTLITPGYEFTEKIFSDIHPTTVLKLAARRALATSGVVVDQGTRRPIPDANVYLLRATGPWSTGNDPRTPGAPLATTDAEGRWNITQLPAGGRYWVFISASGHAASLVEDLSPGQTNLQTALGPELRVRGRIVGDLGKLERQKGQPVVSLSTDYRVGANSSYIASEWLPVQPSGTFEFTNRISAAVTLTAGERAFQKVISQPIDDWVIQLNTGSEEILAAKTREVILRFEHPSGVPPKGSIHLTLPEKALNQAYTKEVEIQNGEVRCEVPVGRNFGYEPGRTIGYWFKSDYSIPVPDAPGALVVPVRMIPAGAIYAEARLPNGSLANHVFFTPVEVEKAPGTAGSTLSGGVNSPQDGRHILSPLPLGGRYQIVASQGNNRVVSDIIKLTEVQPEGRLVLQFKEGKTATGRVLMPDGKPFPGAEIVLKWDIKGHGFQGSPIYTDSSGKFQLENLSPDASRYSIQVRGRDCQTSIASVRFSPMEIQLERGFRLSGRVVEDKTNRPLQRTEVRAIHESYKGPMEYTRTDDQGRFEFTTLGKGDYRLYPGDGYTPTPPPLVSPGRADQVLLKVILATGSNVALGPPPETPSAQ